MHIGKIVSSTSHVEYICQVYGPGEMDPLPRPQEYGFGTFVGIERDDCSYLVGVIYNTTLMNPEFGNLGPRLSPREDLTVFSPDYLTEKVTLVMVAILGAIDAGGHGEQCVPIAAASIDAPVRRLEREEIIAFHQCDHGLRLAYLPTLIGMRSPLMPPLMLQLITVLRELFPEQADRLAVLGWNLAWKSRVEPVG